MTQIFSIVTKEMYIRIEAFFCNLRMQKEKELISTKQMVEVTFHMYNQLAGKLKSWSPVDSDSCFYNNCNHQNKTNKQTNKQRNYS